jgi:hypothetical protein
MHPNDDSEQINDGGKHCHEAQQNASQPCQSLEDFFHGGTFTLVCGRQVKPRLIGPLLAVSGRLVRPSIRRFCYVNKPPVCKSTLVVVADVCFVADFIRPPQRLPFRPRPQQPSARPGSGAGWHRWRDRRPWRHTARGRPLPPGLWGWRPARRPARRRWSRSRPA